MHWKDKDGLQLRDKIGKTSISVDWCKVRNISALKIAWQKTAGSA
jgi:hypothetical protein